MLQERSMSCATVGCGCFGYSIFPFSFFFESARGCGLRCLSAIVLAVYTMCWPDMITV